MSSYSFWLKLKKPILALAPMAGITDCAFRTICREMGADVVYSEMVSADALYYDSKKTMELLKIGKKEYPVVVQLFGKRPELFKKAAKIAESAGADGIDINFGCPAKKIVKDNSGAALMRDLYLSKKIVQTVLDAVDIPVSVKIRAGINFNRTTKQNLAGIQWDFFSYKHNGIYNAGRTSCVHRKIPPNPPLGKGGRKTITALDFMKNIIDLPISAVMVHGRTYEQGFSGEVDYEMIKDVVDLIKIWRGDDAVVLANGGIKNADDVKRMLEKTGAGGIGIAQGALGRPWIFREIKEKFQISNFKFQKNDKILNNKFLKLDRKNKREILDSVISQDEIKKIALHHAKLTYKMKGDYGIIEMRKHLLWYVKGLSEAKELREKLVQVKSIKDIEMIFNQKLKIKN